MEILADNTFRLWQEEGSRLIPQNFEAFRNLVAQARKYVQSGKYDMAAVYAEIAASYAMSQHCGLFVSPELEQLLGEIGRKTIPSDNYYSKNISSRGVTKNVLHVATAMHSIGGHSRMLWRWIRLDTEHSHSLVLTRQAPEKIPKALREAVFNSGGKIHVLNQYVGSLIAWAKQLREIASAADMVVLHIHNFDVIPIIAFADKDKLPPIVFLDHADHLFWLGASVSDVVVSLRETGMKLARTRRGIETERSVMLPIVLEPTQRKLTHTDAKQRLNIPEDNILLLSIARAIKYKTIDGISFADAHVPLLKQYKKAILVIIGPGDSVDWSLAIHQTQGRIRVLGETENTEVFYQAADIYVDSFPFISNTSLLEAGGYGIPLVSRYPYSSDSCDIFGADMPGLTDNLIRVRDLKEYTAVLSRLVEDREYRLFLGQATKNKIAEIHWENNWRYLLNDFYSHVTTVPRVTVTSDATDEMFLDELDVLLPRVHSSDVDINKAIQSHLRLMPFLERLYHWYSLGKKYNWRNNRLNLLLPEWVRSFYYSHVRSLFVRENYLNLERKKESILDSEPIVLVCAADDRYAMPLSVMVRSAIENLKSNRKIALFVIDGGIKKYNKKKILKSLNSKKCEVNFIAIPTSWIESIEEVKKYCETNKKVSALKHLSLAAYYRLFIAELLPEQIEKAIYLDCDLIVEGDLEQLWKIELEDKNYILAVQDLLVGCVSSPEGLLNYQELGIAANSKYFNSGVLAIDLKKWRDDKITAKAIEYLKQNKDYIRFHDQDVLNALLVDRWGELDSRWNLTSFTINKYPSWENSPFSEETYNKLFHEPYIIHYATALKPWNSRHVLYKDYFFRYVDMTAWAGWRLTFWRQFWLKLIRELKNVNVIASITKNINFPKSFTRLTKFDSF